MAVSSSKNLPALMPSKVKSGTALVSEKIDEKILRLLGLEDVFDIDYDTYSSLLRERMASARMANKTLPTEEVEMITNEWKRISKKKGRFKVKKITAESFKKGSAVGINLKKQKFLPGIKLPYAIDKLSDEGGKNDIKQIIDALGEIIKNLTLLNKNQKNTDEKKRKDAEAEKRGLAESALEKGFKGSIKIAEKIIAPIKSLLSRIIDFFTAIFFGRVIVKLLEWFSDPNNAEKIKSIGRFLGNHWPKLLALYIAFGTSFGRFALGLTKVVARGAFSLLSKILLLSKAKKLRAAGKFFGGRGGKGLAGVLATTAVVGGTYAATQGLMGSSEDQKDQKDQKVQTFSGGGFVIPQIPKFSGGGFNPIGMMGGGIDATKGSGMFNGFVSGEKGVDKVPAFLSDGEFVMSRGAVQKYGVNTLESMNAAGGGTNKPKMMNRTVYAAGGGYIGADKLSDPASKENTRKLEERKKKETFGPGTMPTMSTQIGLNKLADKITFEERLKRIEVQVQVQKALASGKGVNIRGAGLGTQLGAGYSTTYQGKKSIIIKGGANNFSTGIGDKEITLAGERYFAQRRGNDVIYSVAKKGGGLVGGSNLKKIDKKKLPPTQIMSDGKGGKPFMGFLTFEKGQPVYKRGAEPGTGTTNPLEALGRWLNPNAYKANDAKSASGKMAEGATNSLEYYRKRGMNENDIKKQMKSLGQDYDKAKNDLEYRNKRPELINQGKSISAQQQMRAKISANQNKSLTPSAPVTPRIKVKTTNSGGRKGSGYKPSTGGAPKTPNFGATCPSSNAPKNKKILGIF